MKYKPEWEAQQNTPGSYNQLTNGRHIVQVINATIITITGKTGAFGALNGMPAIKWEFKVKQGPSAGCRVYHETPLKGKIARKSDGALVDIAFMSAQILRAIDPAYSNQEFDTDDMIGKYLELDIEARIQQDGRVSMWPQRVNGAYPYVEPSTTSTPVETMFGDDDDIKL